MNIVLIGMPGCGKSTAGRALAARLGLKFVCSDEYVEAEAGMSIPEIFDRLGEQGFRELERVAIAALTDRSGVVLSTGGGAVLNAENRWLLAQAGTVVWLKRDISRLSRRGRPLSQGIDALRAMYSVREPIYAQLADIRVTVDGSVDELVDMIVAELRERLDRN